MSGTSEKLLRVAWLFPGTLNLYGERGNLLALQVEAKRRDIPVRVDRVELGDAPTFDPARYDVLIGSPGEIPALGAASDALWPQRERLRDYLTRGGILLSTGSNVALWSHGIDRLDGSFQKGLGLLDVRAQEREFVTGDDLAVRYGAPDGTTQSVISHQIQRLNLYGGPDAEPWAEVSYGYGNCGVGYEGPRIGGDMAVGNRLKQGRYAPAEAGPLSRDALGPLPDDLPRQEGFRLGHAIFTNLLGPVLFVRRRLIRDLLDPWLRERGLDWPTDGPEAALEEEAQAARRDYIRRKVTGSLYHTEG